MKGIESIEGDTGSRGEKKTVRESRNETRQEPHRDDEKANEQ